MKIALVAPSPVPFTIGGAEKLAWGLLSYLNQETSHQAELIKIPARELSFWDLIDSYRAFSQLDLSHFDLVISLKYPAWMINHPRHVLYLLHRLRGLYDTYPPLPPRCESNHPAVAPLTAFLRSQTPSRAHIPECFALLDRLRRATDAPPDLFQFPGPLIREIVRFLDDCALAPPSISKYAAISRNVARRPDYFPAGAEVAVCYPPSDLPSFRSGNSEYFFTISRLDNAKRVRLLVEAMLRAETTLPLKIAGTGPEEASLRALAARDPRIEFLGFVNDADVVDLYANCLAALYVPYDEDYGLVTIEAMNSGKPVLTGTDSGGPNEFVENGLTGFAVPPSPTALAERIDYLATHIAEARAMAPACRAKVAGIRWDSVAETLTGAAPGPRRSSRPRRHITVCLTFPVYPPRGGGKSRVYHLYRHLARQLDCRVELLTFADNYQPGIHQEIAAGVDEIRIAKTDDHIRRESRASRRAGGVPVTDVVMPRLFLLTPEYIAALRQSAASSSLLVSSHPDLITAIEAVRESQPLFYEGHNAEFALKRRMLPKNAMGRYLLRLTHEAERRACQNSDLVSACSPADAEAFVAEYAIPPEKILLAPNGVDLASVTYHPFAERYAHTSPFTVLFLGSWHEPNIEAALFVSEIARRLPAVHFQLLGSVCDYFRVFHLPLPPNVTPLGVLDDRAKDLALSRAHLALNPMEMGSGTNLKILDYMAAGIPVLSTPFGARGLNLVPGEHLLVAPLIEFPRIIDQLSTCPAPQLASITARARAVVEREYSWEAIARSLASALQARIPALAS